MICRTNRWHVDEVFNVEPIMIHDDRLNLDVIFYAMNVSMCRKLANPALFNEDKAQDLGRETRPYGIGLNSIFDVSWSSAVVSRRGLTVTGSGGMRNEE